MSAIPVRRGCGTRVSGAVYLENFGGTAAIEVFLICPPIPLKPELKVPARGVGVILKGTTYHIIDRIGVGQYPSPADWVEETKRYGLSRRISPEFNFGLLTADSRIIMAHDRAIYTNLSHIKAHTPWKCPKYLPAHSTASHGDIYKHGEMCCGLWWETMVVPVSYKSTERDYCRQFPIEPPHTFEYLCRALNPHSDVPVFAAGLFASFPIARIVVVKGGEAESRYGRISRATKLEVALVDN